jgi:hypothetical protein
MVARIQFGCGSNQLQGWHNFDRDHDITQPLRCQDSCVDYVFAEHVLEHVTMQQAINFLRECYRILKPHGIVRIAVPSIERIFQYGNDADYIAFCDKWAHPSCRGTLRGPLDAIVYSHGHQMIWSAGTLKPILYLVGFDQVRECRPGQSTDPQLCNLEGHGRVIGERFNDIETIVVEGDK